MATYTRVSPATLTNWLAVINDPTDAEDANKLGQVDLQTRQFVYDFLTQVFTSGTPSLTGEALNLGAGSIRGSTSNTGTQQEVAQGTVSSPDFRSKAVNTAAIADGAVGATQIAAGAVGTTQLAAGAVGATQIAAGAVGTTQIATGGVASANLASGAVVSASIAAGAVGTTQLAAGAVTSAIIANGAVGLTQLDPTLAIAKLGIVVLQEQAASGTNGGSSLATTWMDRGSPAAGYVPWVNVIDTATSSYVVSTSVGGASGVQLLAGTYVIKGRAPGNAVGGHQTKLLVYTAIGGLVSTTYGTPEVAASGSQTASVVSLLVTLTAGQYFKLQHYTTNAVSTTGLGAALTLGGEVFASLEITKIS